MNPELIREYFYVGKMALGGLLLLGGWFWFNSQNSAFFKPRQPRRKPIKPGDSKDDSLAQARIEKKGPLLLGGIRVDAPPHEILGVRLGASASEIQKAYREKMKQYHPDKVDRPGTQAWNDAQIIAEAINRAKDELLKRAKA